LYCSPVFYFVPNLEKLKALLLLGSSPFLPFDAANIFVFSDGLAVAGVPAVDDVSDVYDAIVVADASANAGVPAVAGIPAIAVVSL
jgi:hypothetical protein